MPTFLRLLSIASAAILVLGGDADAQTVTTIAGDGQFSCPAPGCGDSGPATSATFINATGVVVDAAGNVFIADSGNFVVRRVDAATGTISTYAGVQGVFGDCTAGCGDGGPATSATLSTPYGLALDASGNLYIADQLNGRIRKVDAATGLIDTVAGAGFGDAGQGDGGPAVLALFAFPQGVAVDAAGHLYIADTQALRVRRVDAVTGIITTIAGSMGNTLANGGVGGGDGGLAVDAAFNAIRSVAVDAGGNVYILELRATGEDAPNHQTSLVRRIDAATGIVRTIAGGGTGSGTSGLAVDAFLGNNAGDIASDAAGNLYIAGNHITGATVTDAHRIWRVNPTGAIGVVAGTGASGFSGDGGPATSAEFRMLEGVGVGGSGDVFISDAGNSRVRRVSATVVVPPPDLLVDTATSQAVLDALVDAPASVVMSNAAGRTTLLLPNLVSVGCDLRVTNNPDLTTFSAPALQDVGCDLNVSGNPMLADVSLSGGPGIGGSVTIRDNDAATTINLSGAPGIGGSVTIRSNDSATHISLSNGGVIVGDITIVDNDLSTLIDVSSSGGVDGNVTILDNGDAVVAVDAPFVTGDFHVGIGSQGSFDFSSTRVDGDVIVDGSSNTIVTGETAGGSTSVTVVNGSATMNAFLPDGTFDTNVSFTIEPLTTGGSLTGQIVDGSSNTIMVTEVAAYRFTFAIPTLNADATLTFGVSLALLDDASRSAFLEALASDRATLGVKGDAPGSGLQVMPVCAVGEVPTAGGCAEVVKMDAAGIVIPAGDPTIPATVTFTGVTGHFSIFGVVLLGDPDTTPPAFSNVPADIVAEATSPSGAVVDYPIPTALDDRDGAVDVLCAPGSSYPLGTTIVTCTASDTAGNVSAASFLVTVVDTTPPVLLCSPNLVVSASSASGAIVTFPAASASDAVDLSPTVIYSHASGSLFPIGTTTVTATATDASGNSSTCSFTVTVTPPGADIAVEHSASPSPATVGSPLTYTVTIGNHGPNEADVFVASAVLGAVRLVSATATQGRCAAVGTVAACSLGSLGAGASATVTIVVVPTATGTVLGTALGWSRIADPEQANNRATVMTPVRR